MKFPALKETRTGWTKWQYPIMRKYQMACCDCGLVHTVQFRVVEETVPDNRKGEFELRSLGAHKLRIGMRAKRNAKQTRLLRKKDRITVTH